MHFPTLLVLAMLTALAGACDDMAVTSPAGTHAVGILEWQAQASSSSLASGRGSAPGTAPRPGVAAPDSVRAGVPFTAVVTTVGPTICWEAAGAQVELQPAAANITPFDFTPEDHWTACGDALSELPRRVEVVFHHPGQAVLRVHGRRVVGSNFASDDRVVLEKRIRVL